MLDSGHLLRNRLADGLHCSLKACNFLAALGNTSAVAVAAAADNHAMERNRLKTGTDATLRMASQPTLRSCGKIRSSENLATTGTGTHCLRCRDSCSCRALLSLTFEKRLMMAPSSRLKNRYCRVFQTCDVVAGRQPLLLLADLLWTRLIEGVFFFRTKGKKTSETR